MMKSLLLFLALFSTTYAYADDIEFPEEELARETTLPVFDKRRAVLNRSVVTAKRLEIGLGGGLEVNEPYYSDAMFGFQGTYNFNETSAFNLTGLFWTDGLSSYGEQLKEGGKHEQFDAEKAPHPKWAVLGNYEFIAYYGKISVSKQTVMNLNLFAIIGAGYLNMDTLNTIAFNIGFGQNFFFTNWLGLRADIRWLIFQGPNATSQQLRPQDSPSASSFDDRIYYNTQLGLSLVFVL